MIRKHDCKRFYSVLYHTLARIVFWFTLIVVIIYNICVFRIRILGKKNLRIQSKGAFLISNHVLYFDSAIIAHIIAPRRVFFTALEETFLLYFIGTYIRYLGAFPVSNSMPYNIFISNIKKIFNNGNFIHFFPEGELSHLNLDINNFKNGVFFLAFKLNRPVIPVTIITKPRTSLSKGLNHFFCRVTVAISKPVYPSQFKHSTGKTRNRIKCMANYCRHIMMEEYKKNRNL